METQETMDTKAALSKKSIAEDLNIIQPHTTLWSHSDKDSMVLTKRLLATDQWNVTEINPNSSGHLTFDKGTTIKNHWNTESLCNKSCL